MAHAMKNNSPPTTPLKPLSSSNQYMTQVSQSKDANLTCLTKDMLQIAIGAFLSPDDKFHLSRVSHNLHGIFKKDASQHIHQFLTHVVRGDKKQVHAFLQKNPRLLLEKIKVTDHAGRKIYGTAYQIALGAKDVSPSPEQYHEMAEMIADFFDKIPNGDIEKEKQYSEQFPEDFEEQEFERKIKDQEAVRVVFQKIAHATSIAAAEDAVEDFQRYILESLEPVITSGYHFNEDLFHEATMQYELTFTDRFNNNKFAKSLASNKVLGFIQRFFTANFAQANCTGFRNIINEDRPLSRSLLLCDGKTSFFDNELGVSHYVHGYLKGDRGNDDWGWMYWLRLYVEKYIEKKNESIKKFAPQPEATQKTWCHIA